MKRIGIVTYHKYIRPAASNSDKGCVIEDAVVRFSENASDMKTHVEGRKYDLLLVK